MRTWRPEVRRPVVRCAGRKLLPTVKTPSCSACSACSCGGGGGPNGSLTENWAAASLVAAVVVVVDLKGERTGDDERAFAGGAAGVGGGGGCTGRAGGAAVAGRVLASCGGAGGCTLNGFSMLVTGAVTSAGAVVVVVVVVDVAAPAFLRRLVLFLLGLAKVAVGKADAKVPVLACGGAGAELVLVPNKEAATCGWWGVRAGGCRGRAEEEEDGGGATLSSAGVGDVDMTTSGVGTVPPTDLCGFPRPARLLRPAFGGDLRGLFPRPTAWNSCVAAAGTCPTSASSALPAAPAPGTCSKELSRNGLRVGLLEELVGA